MYFSNLAAMSTIGPPELRDQWNLAEKNRRRSEPAELEQTESIDLLLLACEFAHRGCQADGS
jgi:hypothetical protein